MQTSDLTTMTAAEAGTAIRERRISPVELTHAYLDRIERLNPLLNAYVTVTTDLALDQAREAEAAVLRGQHRGPLHGVPIALKDLYATRGIRTTAGSRILADWIPDEDATVTARLREAGAVLLGKLNTHEFAFGVTTNNPHFGATRNPWDTERIPGGSSGGSGAAVAANLAALTLGTDTGGSIRIPASLCGVVGLKPTHGRVSTSGIVPLSWTLDHPGPLTHSVLDAAIVLSLIAGPDPRDTSTHPVPLQDYVAAAGGGIAGTRGDGAAAGVRGMRLAVPRAGFYERMDPEVAAAVEAALDLLRDLGAVVEEVAAPLLWQGRYANNEITLAESRHYHAASLRDRPHDFGVDVISRLNRRTDQSAAELVAAFRQRDAAMQEAALLLTRYDALITPATRIVAPALQGGKVVLGSGYDAEASTVTADADELGSVAAARVLLTNTAPFNLTGMPALSLPCGFTAAGLPIGLQIAGRRWDEATVLRIAAAYEAATPWHTRSPVLLEG